MDNISRFQKTTGVGQILDESFARCPEREAIVFGDWRITYRELQALIYRTAHCLRSLGIAPGDRVAIISRNCPEVMIAEIAIMKLGGTVVKFNWRLAPEEMIYLLDLNEVRCAFFKPEREDWGDALRQHYAGRITFLSLTPEADGRSALYSLLAGMPDTPVETVVAPTTCTRVARPGGRSAWSTPTRAISTSLRACLKRWSSRTGRSISTSRSYSTPRAPAPISRWRPAVSSS